MDKWWCKSAWHYSSSKINWGKTISGANGLVIVSENTMSGAAGAVKEDGEKTISGANGLVIGAI